MASSPTQQDAPQLLKWTHCQNCTKLLKLLSTHFICTYLRKFPFSPATRQILEKISPELIQQLNDVKSRVMASPRNLDVDSIVHVHASLQRERQSYWHLIIITTMHNYDHRNPLLLPTLLFIPQNITLFFYTQSSKPSYSYPITLLHTPPRNKLSNKHRSPKDRNFYDVLATSHLERLTLTASKTKRQYETASSLRTSAREHSNSAMLANSRPDNTSNRK